MMLSSLSTYNTLIGEGSPASISDPFVISVLIVPMHSKIVSAKESDELKTVMDIKTIKLVIIFIIKILPK
jgi:hypothetical protein